MNGHWRERCPARENHAPVLIYKHKPTCSEQPSESVRESVGDASSPPVISTTTLPDPASAAAPLAFSSLAPPFVSAPAEYLVRGICTGMRVTVGL